MPQFIEDVQEIRQRAARKIEDGAVTDGYHGDVEKAIDILNEALATEIVCVLRYQHHYFMASGVHGRSVANEFKEHADAEREHANMIAERIQQLGGKPNLDPKGLSGRSTTQYVEGETLAGMIREDLIAERIVIEVYQEMIRYFGSDDPTTRRLLEQILADEEEHANDLSDLLYVVDPRTGETEGQDPGTDQLSIRTKRAGAEERRQNMQEKPVRPDGKKTPEPFAGRGSVVEPVNAEKAKHQREVDTAEAGAQPVQGRVEGTGTTGRTMNRRRNEEEVDTSDRAQQPARGASSGGSRSNKTTNKNRKDRAA